MADKAYEQGGGDAMIGNEAIPQTDYLMKYDLTSE
jgi:hypothetical protein